MSNKELDNSTIVQTYADDFVKSAKVISIISTFAGCSFLVWFCSTAKVPFPSDSASLILLFLVLAYAGALFVVFALVTVFLPFFMSTVDRYWLRNQKLTFGLMFRGFGYQRYRFFLVFGIPLLATHCYILKEALVTYKDIYTCIFIGLAIIATISFFIGNWSGRCLSLKAWRWEYALNYLKQLSLAFFTFLIFLLWTLYLILIFIQFLLFNFVSPEQKVVEIYLVIGQIAISFLLIAIIYAANKSTYRKFHFDKKKILVIFCSITLFSVFVFPLTSTIGGASLSILNIGGYKPICFEFDQKELSNVTKKAFNEENKGFTSKPLKLVHLIGTDYHVVAYKNKNQPFTIPKKVVSSRYTPVLSESSKKLVCEIKTPGASPLAGRSTFSFY